MSLGFLNTGINKVFFCASMILDRCSSELFPQNRIPPSFHSLKVGVGIPVFVKSEGFLNRFNRFCSDSFLLPIKTHPSHCVNEDNCLFSGGWMGLYRQQERV